jgi:hypothetical protein
MAVAPRCAAKVDLRLGRMCGGAGGSRFTEMGLPMTDIVASMQEIRALRERIRPWDVETSARVCGKLAEGRAR